MILRNSLANFFGQFLAPILSILLVPFYLHYLGLEGYGLIGFFSMLITVLGIFTKGLGSALQREIAVRSGSADGRKSLRRLVNTFERVYWSFGAFLSIILLLLAGPIARRWLQAKTISQSSLLLCVIAISFTLVLAFPSSIYGAVFVGTQKQVRGNFLSAIGAISGALLNITAIVIWKSVIAFYFAGVLNALITISLLRFGMQGVLPRPSELKGESFFWKDFSGISTMAIGLVWTNGIGLLIFQMDRLFISKMMILSQLGVYTAAAVGGRFLMMFTTPVLNATFPQICQLGQGNQGKRFVSFLNRNLSIIVLLGFNVGLFISFHARDILYIWTRNQVIVGEGAEIMALYIFGNILQAGGGVFYQAQLAKGVTRYGVWSYSTALVAYPLALALLIPRLGLEGAAWAWIGFSLYHFIFMTYGTLKIIGFLYLVSFFKTIILGFIIAFPIIWGSMKLAWTFFPQSSLLRLIFGGGGAFIALATGYIVFFGFHIPDEFRRFLLAADRKLRNNKKR